MCSSSRPAVAAKAPCSVACDRRDDAGGRHLADPCAAFVKDVQVTRCIDSDSLSSIQLSGSCGPAIAAKTQCSVACYRGDDAGGRHLSNTIIACVRDKQIACRIDSNAGHKRPALEAETGRRCWTAISTETGHAVSGNGRDDSVQCDLANAIVAHVLDKEITCCINCHAAHGAA